MKEKERTHEINDHDNCASVKKGEILTRSRDPLSLSLLFFNPLRANTKRLDEYQCVDNIRGVLFHETDDWLFSTEVEESKESGDKGWSLFRYFVFAATLHEFYWFKTFVRSST